jgi:UDP-glucose 4-epimerase
MKCVVTGAAGFVGSTICDRLLADGYEVLGVDCFVDYYPRRMKEQNLIAARAHPRFTFLEDNLCSGPVTEWLKGATFVFHQAAQAGVRASWGATFETYTQNNITGTQRLLEALKGHPTVKKVVYASSSSVYGDAEALPTPETARPQPVSPYGVTKLAAEHLMVLYAKEFAVPTVSLRYFTVFGPRQRPDMAFHRFIRAGLRNEQLTLYGDGEQSRDFTFIDDIVEANIRAALDAAPGEVFNVGGGDHATVNQVLALIEKHIGPLRIDRRERQAGDARHTSADTSRIQRQLGFSPRVSLSDGIAREVEWLRSAITEG